MTKTLEQIKTDYNNGEYKNKIVYVQRRNKLKIDHVFDEEKSVRWNKEQVEKHNDEIEMKIQEYKKESERLRDQFDKDMIESLTYEYKFNDAQARKIYSYVYSEFHGSMNDVFNRLEELADIVEEIIKLQG